MFLRLFLHILKPTNEQLKSKSNGTFVRYKIKIYRLLLIRLLKTYLHYQLSDTILINKGQIKIVHEFRDVAFESELLRNRITIIPELVNHSIPVSTRKSKGKHHFLFFDFKNLLSIYIGGKELFVKHDDKYSIDGTVGAKIKCSSNTANLSQSIIDIISISEPANPNHIIEPNWTNPSRDNDTDNITSLKHNTKISMHNIFGKDKGILIEKADLSTKCGAPLHNSKQPQFIKKKGFDIDTSF